MTAQKGELKLSLNAELIYWKKQKKNQYTIDPTLFCHRKDNENTFTCWHNEWKSYSWPSFCGVQLHIDNNVDVYMMSSSRVHDNHILTLLFSPMSSYLPNIFTNVREKTSNKLLLNSLAGFVFDGMVFPHGFKDVIWNLLHGGLITWIKKQ